HASTDTGTQGSVSGSTSGQQGSVSGTTSGQQGSVSGSTSGTQGSVSGSTNMPSSGSTYGSNAPTTGGSVSGSASSDNASLRTVTGSVAKVDQNSITLDQSAGGVTLTVDSQTQVIRRGQPIAAGISAIHEGQQVRASFDPASNRPDKIEVMGKPMKHKKGMYKTNPNPSGDTTNANPRR